MSIEESGSGSELDEPDLPPEPVADDDAKSQGAISFKTSKSAERDLDSDSDADTVHERSDSQIMLAMGDDRASAHSDSNLSRRKSSLIEMQQMMAQQLNQYAEDGMGRGSELTDYEEIQQFNDDKQYFSELFDKIDLENNGDVDGQEFRMGLERIGVFLTEDQVQKLFVLLDADASGYIDRNEWINFLMQPFQNPNLRELQEIILGNVRRHSRSGSNLVRPADMNDLTATEMNRMQSEMSQQMNLLVTQEIQKVQEEENFYNEIEEAAEDPNFCQPENAGNWDIREVVYWLSSCKFEEYILAFKEEGIDGSILLNDVNRELLETMLLVKPVHVSKMLREIDRIRNQNKVDLGHSVSYKDLEDENTRLKDELTAAQAVIKELEEKLQNVQANPLAAMMSGGASGAGASSMGLMDGGMDSATNSLNRNSSYSAVNPMMMLNVQLMEMNQKLMNNVLGSVAASVGDGGAALEEKEDVKKLSDDEDEKALEVSAVEEIERLRKEVDELRQSKIELAVATGEEIASLREIVKLLSQSLERETATPEETPGAFDQFLNVLGLGQNGYESDYESESEDRGRGRGGDRDKKRDRDRGDRDRDRRRRDRDDDRDDRRDDRRDRRRDRRDDRDDRDDRRSSYDDRYDDRRY